MRAMVFLLLEKLKNMF